MHEKSIISYIQDDERYEITYDLIIEQGERIVRVSYSDPHLIENIGENFTFTISNKGVVSLPYNEKITQEGQELIPFFVNDIWDHEQLDFGNCDCC